MVSFPFYLSTQTRRRNNKWQAQVIYSNSQNSRYLTMSTTCCSSFLHLAFMCFTLSMKSSSLSH